MQCFWYFDAGLHVFLFSLVNGYDKDKKISTFFDHVGGPVQVFFTANAAGPCA